MRLLLLLNDVKPPIPGVAPVVTANPAITGLPVVGVVLAYGNGTATGTPSPAVGQGQWQTSPNGSTGWTNIVVAHTYTIVVGDVGNYLRVLLTWTNASGSALGTSPAVGPVTNPVSPPAGVSPPVIS